MDEETRRRCLEPFFTTKGERGTGLGLAMVYGTVRRHNAGIDIESAPERGTTVRLSFPAPASAVAAPVPSRAVPVVPATLRVLVVDDDPLLLKSLRDALEVDGHAIVTANGGQQGIDLFRAALNGQPGFDAVLTDLGMPYVDGRQVAEFVKAASPSTPVILLTGWGYRGMTEGDIPAHVDILLSKPPKLREALVRCCEWGNRMASGWPSHQRVSIESIRPNLVDRWNRTSSTKDLRCRPGGATSYRREDRRARGHRC
jgi:CheY-like chemotaxis protein